MILMRENPFRGPLKRMGPENRDFFGPWNDNGWSECHLDTKKVEIAILKCICGQTFAGLGLSNWNRFMLLSWWRPCLDAYVQSHVLATNYCVTYKPSDIEICLENTKGANIILQVCNFMCLTAMPKSQQSWVRSQHPPTPWNLRGRQMKQCWIQNKKYKKSIFFRGTKNSSISSVKEGRRVSNRNFDTEFLSVGPLRRIDFGCNLCYVFL